MESLLVLTRVPLGLVLLAVGLATLLDRNRTRNLVALGVPSRWCAPFGVLLAVAELGAALYVLPLPADLSEGLRPVLLASVLVVCAVCGVFAVTGFRAAGRPEPARTRGFRAAGRQQVVRTRKAAIIRRLAA